MKLKIPMCLGAGLQELSECGSGGCDSQVFPKLCCQGVVPALWVGVLCASLS